RVGKRVLIVSTDHVFGRVKEDELPEKGWKETGRVSYAGPYDTSKSAMELCVRSYHYTYWSQLPAVGVTRAANVFGCGDVAPTRVIPLFVSHAVEPPHEIPLRYRMNGRQFIHLTDVISGYIRAAASLNEDDPGQRKLPEGPPIRSPFTPTFHFAIEDYGTTEPFIRMKRLGELTEKICVADGAKLVETNDCVDYAPHENPIQALNCEWTRQRLGWMPKVTLAEGVTELGDWYRHKNDAEHLKDLLNRDVGRILESLGKVDPVILTMTRPE
ncbi:MAG: NAD-dependent epimerase/dehydratase family protein, partial [Bacteroidota bacterium]